MVNVNVLNPGRDLTATATSAVTAKRLVQISSSRVNGNIAVAPAPAGGRALGVAVDTVAAGELVGVARGASRVVLVSAAGAIAAGAEVEIGAAGAVIAKASGTAIGFAITSAVNGGDAQISLYA